MWCFSTYSSPGFMFDTLTKGAFIVCVYSSVNPQAKNSDVFSLYFADV